MKTKEPKNYSIQKVKTKKLMEKINEQDARDGTNDGGQKDQNKDLMEPKVASHYTQKGLYSYHSP